MSRQKYSRFGAGLLVLTAMVFTSVSALAAGSSSVAIVRTAEWSQGDQAREGAAEFLVFMEIARLQRTGDPVGVVAVGDRRGLFSHGAEEALQHAVRKGVPVVKLAQGGQVMPVPHGLFLDGGNLTVEAASQILARCLERYGPLPTSPDRLKERLHAFQSELTLAGSSRLAVR